MGLAGTPALVRAETPSIAIPPVLARDERLTAPLAVAVKDRPLGEVLPELGKELGVPLSAARETADDKITLFIKERPAREVLALIATHFDFQWRRERGGYRLCQDLASRNREQAARDAHDAAEIVLLQQTLESLAALGPVTQAAVMARGKQLRERARSPELSDEEHARIWNEFETWRRAADPGTGAVVGLLGRLAPHQQAAFWRGQRLRFGTQDRTLPRDLAAAVRRAAPTGQDTAEYAEASISLVLRRAPRREGRPGPLSIEGMLHLHSDRGTLGSGWRLPAGEIDRQPRMAEWPEHPSLELPVELPPWGERELPNERLLQALELAPGGTRTLGDLLEILHRQSGLDFIADSYTPVRINREEYSRLADQRMLWAVLEAVAGHLDYDWTLEGSLVRCRSAWAPFLRLEEVPQAVIEEFRQGVQTGLLTLADLAGLATRLSDPQVAALSSRWGWYFPEGDVLPFTPADLYPSRGILRWWAALTRAQQQALQKSELPAAALSPAQQEGLFLALFQTGDRDLSFNPWPGPEHLPQLSIGLRREASTDGVYVNPEGRVSSRSIRPLGSGGTSAAEGRVLAGPPLVRVTYGLILRTGGEDPPRRSHWITTHLLPREPPRPASEQTQ
jgi:hypothetical protein